MFGRLSGIAGSERAERYHLLHVVLTLAHSQASLTHAQGRSSFFLSFRRQVQILGSFSRGKRAHLCVDLCFSGCWEYSRPCFIIVRQTEGVTGSHQNCWRGETREAATQKGTTGRQEERLKGPALKQQGAA